MMYVTYLQCDEEDESRARAKLAAGWSKEHGLTPYREVVNSTGRLVDGRLVITIIWDDYVEEKPQDADTEILEASVLETDRETREVWTQLRNLVNQSTTTSATFSFPSYATSSNTYAATTMAKIGT